MRGWIRSLNEGLSLFWKIQIASTVLILVAVYIGNRSHPADPGLLRILLVVLVAGAALINSLILRAALLPTERLRQQLTGIGTGETRPYRTVQVEGDPLTRSIAETINAMIHRLETSQRETTNQAFQAEQAERRRIARDLHDDVSQRVARLVARLKEASESPPEEASRLFKDLSQGATEVLERVRRTMAALHPLVLDDLGFTSALEWLLDQELPDIEHEVSFAAPDPERETAAVLFRVAQEALTNIRRHARATRVWLRTFEQEDLLILEIEDDGRGIPSDRMERPGYGLRGMRERIQGIQGEMRMWSQSDQGTAIQVSVPIVKEAD